MAKQTKEDLEMQLAAARSIINRLNKELDERKKFDEFEESCDESAKQLKALYKSFKKQGFSEEFIQQMVLASLRGMSKQ